jgi:P4 family phage/plasmid primase-like protien
MEKVVKKYNKKKLIVFSVNVEQKNNGKTWKKQIKFPPKWTELTMETAYLNNEYNGMALITGEVSNIIVIDIDNREHWKKILEEQNQKEPDTVKAISGSGGYHYYFKYTKDLSHITSKDHCFGKDYDIDVKTNGGCVIIPPTKYFNKNVDKDVKYKWEKSIFDYDPIEMPVWMKKLLLEKLHAKHEEKKVEKPKEKNIETKEENIETYKFIDDEIEKMVEMLSKERTEGYESWINVGMCLYNINTDYLYIWKKFSKKSAKYDETECKNKWKSFNKNKNGLKIGSLIMWCKEDNKEAYEKVMEKKKAKELISLKYPKDKLELAEFKEIGKNHICADIEKSHCLIKGGNHADLFDSMYIEVALGHMALRCKHPECYGKIHCGYIPLTKQEMSFIFNGDININITQKDDELVEFQKIEIYEDKILNELIYNGLNGEAYPQAKIIFYYNKDNFNYGEDNNWYIFENHKWKNIGQKNPKLRDSGHEKLKELYQELLKYYKEKEFDKTKIKAIRQLIKSLDNTGMKNNIMTELVDLFSINRDKHGNFTMNLDSNNYLLGFDNGVYDLKTFEFRAGIPNDYITMSVGYDYNNNHTNKYNELLKFLEDILPNKEERDYILTYLAIGLVGNILELFTILTGNGRNGKSKLIELLKTMLGGYFGAVQSQMFTRARPDANSPDPGLLSLSKKRIVIASEPEKNSKLNSGFIKFITGRDSTTLRNCHSNDMIDFSAKFITLFICNDIPECDDIDNAFSKRLRCINFPTEFVMDPKKENQKKINTDINQNFEYWKLDFMLLLIEYYKKYVKKTELKATENILKWTNQYKEDTDMYLQFLNECTEDSEAHIHMQTIYDKFKGWFKNNNPNTKIPSNKEFTTNIKKYKEIKKHVRIDKKISSGINNLRLKEDNFGND